MIKNSYKACGSGTYDKQRTVCIPDSIPCPVTGAEVGSSLPSGYSSADAQKTDDSNYNYYIRFEADDEMPINHIELVLYDPNGKRGQCFLGGSNQENYDGKTSSYTYQNNYPTSCSTVDKRWVALDYQTENEYLTENFELLNSCLYDTDTLDYVSTLSQCGSAPLSDTDCMV